MAALNLDFNALTNSLTTIVKTVDGSYTNITTFTGPVLTSLGIIDIALWGAWVMLGSETLGGGVKKFISLQIWLWIIHSFQGIAKWLMKGLVGAAFAATGQSGGGYQALLDPSNIAGRGLDVTLPLAQKIDAVSPLDVGTIMLMGGLLLLIMLAFIVMAVNVAWAVIEYYIYLCLAGLLMPFALLAQTRFLADKGINAVIAATLKLVAYAFVLGLIKPILGNIEFHKDFGLKLGLNWNDIFSMVMVVLFCLGLCVKVPQIAAGFIHGSPSISGSGMVLGLAGAAAYGAAALAQGAAGAVGWAGGRIAQGLNAVGDRIPPAEESAMGAATRAGTMGGSGSMGGSAPAAAGGGAMFVAAYYPASHQLGKVADLALPENVIDTSGGELGPGDDA